MINTTIVNVFWDLDGVVFKYEREAYIGDKPMYAEPGYFKDRPVDKSACELFDKIMDKQDICRTHILSRGATRLNQEQRKNVMNDKKINVSNVFPILKSEDVIITELSKVEAAIDFLGRPLTRTDILIDDFNENLLLWEKAGGSAVKYLNGLNSAKSYKGPKIEGTSLIDVPEFEKYIYKKIFI